MKKTACGFCDGHCNDFQPLNTMVDYSGIEIAFHFAGMLRVRYFEAGRVKAQDVVMVKVCPKCGRALGNG